MTKVTYRPRNDLVLFEMIDKGQVRGVLMPQIAQQGKEKIVRAIGPTVEGLEVGDKVMVIGEIGQDVIVMPSDRGLFCTRQQNVFLIVEESDVD